MTWWTLTWLKSYIKPTSLRVACTTNYADHLFLAWSNHRPKRSAILRTIRGRLVRCGYIYYWDTPHIIEQSQHGDTIRHDFQFPTLWPGSLVCYYIFAPGGPYGLQIQGPLICLTLPDILYWAPHMIVATQLKGIFETHNFSGPEGGHPTWEPINSGLQSLRIYQFHGDLYDPINRQYCLAGPGINPTVYRRQPPPGKAWIPILTPSQARTLTGATRGYICWVCSNFNRPGYLYVLFFASPWGQGTWCIRSPDYGNTWHPFQIWSGTHGNTVSTLMAGVAQGSSPYPAGDVIYLAYNSYVAGRQTLFPSIDNGETWHYSDDVGLSMEMPRCQVDPTDQSICYLGGTLGNSHQNRLYRSEEYPTNLIDVSHGYPVSIFLTYHPSQMWIHPTNNSFMKVLANDHVFQSWDYCATWEDLGPIMVHAEHFHVPDATPGYIYLGRDESAPLPPDMGWPHVMFASDDHGHTMIGKCGAHAQQSDGRGDSIPYDCGGIAFDGMLPLY